jgi:hypothetical protein
MAVIPVPETSYVRFCPVNRIREFGLDPLTITGLILSDLRDHFREGQIENPRLADLVWRPRADDPTGVDETRTGVMIEAFGYDYKQVAGSHAAITVRRGDYDGSRKLSIGQNAYQGDMGAHAPPLAGVEYTNLIAGTHQVACATDSPGLTDLLGWEVYRQLAHFAAVWCRHYGFAEFAVSGLSAQQIEPGTRFEFVARVTASYAWADNWVVAETGPRLSRVGIELDVR